MRAAGEAQLLRNTRLRNPPQYLTARRIETVPNSPFARSDLCSPREAKLFPCGFLCLVVNCRMTENVRELANTRESGFSHVGCHCSDLRVRQIIFSRDL